MPISPGFAAGVAVVYEQEVERRLALAPRAISRLDIGMERDRLDEALERSRHDLQSVAQSALGEPRLVDAAALLSAHAAMAAEIAAVVRQRIEHELISAEEALNLVIREFVVRFARLDSSRACDREQDVRDVGRRMMGHLAGPALGPERRLPPGSVLVARELLPSEAVELARSKVAAIVCEYGGAFSHTAIVARSLGIPAVSGVVGATAHVRPGMRLLVDGEAGRVVLLPTQAEEAVFEERARSFQVRTAVDAEAESLPCATRDGLEVSLWANIGLPDEIEGVHQHHLAGTGLFRTEFLFLESLERPSLETQLAVYARMAERLGELPLVIRTFDLGGDKLPPFLLSEGSADRASLQLRGLRFSLMEQQLLEVQLSAILQVAQTANVRILFPMVVGVDDLARAIAAMGRVADRLGCLRRPPVGAMIETPAALFALDEILELVDFAAIGTNDLTQFMLAADRDLAAGTDDCTATHPAVLRAIRKIVEAAERRSRSVCVCGEEAGEPDVARLLVGLGVRELSLTPSRAADVRRSLRSVNSLDARRVADQALGCRTPRQVRALLHSLQSHEPAADKETSPAAGRRPSGSPSLVPAAAGPLRARGPGAIRHCSRREPAARKGTAKAVAVLEADEPLDLARQEERLAAVAFETHDSIVITDQDGTILRVNKSFTRLTGYAPEEVVGKSTRILKSGRHGPAYYLDMWRALQTEGGWQGEIWNRRKDGHVFLQRLTIACVKNEAGETTHYVCDGQDLTLSKQGEADLASIQAARRVQESLLPTRAPRLPGVDIAGAVHPADRVSGDFFDYLWLGEGSIGVLVADVSGHGLGPALLMAQTQAYLRALSETCSDPGELVARANHLFSAGDSEHFVTLFLARLDVAARTLDYVGAGHQAYLIARDGAVRLLESTSVPLGFGPTISPNLGAQVELSPGDTLVVPTDGIEEAMDPGGAQLGRRRMLELIRDHRDRPAQEIVEALFQAARDFAALRTQEDDITAVVLKVLGQPADDSSAPAADSGASGARITG